jgi:8-oxo-dGTP pyrophosphatase MutT (NUDIX family)
MNILATFDAKDYHDTTSVYEKYSVRGIIVRDGKLAMQCSREGEYKIPGGGLETGENYRSALIREVREETGLHVIEDAIIELGEIVEMRRDIFNPAVKYICHSIFYYCEVGQEQDELRLTQSEIDKGYELKWATPQEVYQRNILIEKDPWIVRDTAFVKMLMDQTVVLPMAASV